MDGGFHDVSVVADDGLGERAIRADREDDADCNRCNDSDHFHRALHSYFLFVGLRCGRRPGG